MNSTRSLVIAVGLILGGQLAFAQEMALVGSLPTERAGGRP